MTHMFELANKPIRVDARGQWLHGSDPILARVAAFFCKHVVVAENGNYAIRIGPQVQPLLVDDTAFWVRSMSWEGGAGKGIDPQAIEHLLLHLSDGQVERLDARTLMQSADNVLYCRLLRQGFSVPCRFSAQQYHDLALRAHADEESFVLPLGGTNYRIGAYESAVQRLPSAQGSATQ